MSKQCLTRRRMVNFSVAPEIGTCGRVGRYFPTRLPPEGRSEGGSPVGVLFGRNGGRRKISPVKVAGSKCSNDGLASVRLREDCNMTGV